MKYHPVCKAAAIIISALMVVVICFSLMSCWFLLEANLYTDDMDSLLGRLKDHRAEHLASGLISRYANEQLSNVPFWLRQELTGNMDDEILSRNASLEPGTWSYELQTAAGVVLQSTVSEKTVNPTVFYNYRSDYYMLAEPDTESNTFTYFSNGQAYELKQVNSSPYQISIYIQDEAITAAYGLPIETIRGLYDLRFHALAILAVSALLCLGCLVYLCLAAGKSRHTPQVAAGGLNRIPLDLYTLVTALCCYWLCHAVYGMSPLHNMFFHAGNTVDGEQILKLILSGVFAFAGGLLATGLVFAVAAQCKQRSRFWLKNTLCWRIAAPLFRLLGKLISMLPVMWQWLLVALGMALSVLFSLLLGSEFLVVFSLLNCVAVVVYGAYAFGALLTGAKRLAEGKLTEKVPEAPLWGAFRAMARQMNALAAAATVAAEEKLRSDRMKTELITNVTHDIKTPLTSIINYTDLLKKAETPQQQEEYLEVLDRQSQRLKKLIEDLTELSKASTGNIHADIRQLDATEALNQALGEFSDRFSAAQLQLCTDIPAEKRMILADGRLLWRVMANLLGNTVKYAMPGTRVYVALKQQENSGVISIKNISREPLNITAQELMERFVRGDQSRNTEGSGLGLSIAASLMEAQGGSLRIEVNGDLFAAELYFPK